MSRSFVRLMAGVALVAVPMVAVEAQCTVVGPLTSCNVARNATFQIPTLAYMQLDNAGDIAIVAPTDWNAFLTAGTPVTTLTAAPMTIRANTTYGVSLTGGAITGGNRPLSAHGFKFQNGACTAGGFTTLTTGAQPLITAGAAATNGNLGNLCLSSDFAPTDFVGSLAAGSYTIPLTLTITAP